MRITLNYLELDAKMLNGISKEEQEQLFKYMYKILDNNPVTVGFLSVNPVSKSLWVSLSSSCLFKYKSTSICDGVKLYLCKFLWQRVSNAICICLIKKPISKSLFLRK